MILADLHAAFEAGLRDDKCVMVQQQMGLDLLAVIEAAKAMRAEGVEISLMVLNPPTMSDAKAVNEFLRLFDGPLQRVFDAALAKLETANPTR